MFRAIPGIRMAFNGAAQSKLALLSKQTLCLRKARSIHVLVLIASELTATVTPNTRHT